MDKIKMTTPIVEMDGDEIVALADDGGADTAGDRTDCSHVQRLLYSLMPVNRLFVGFPDYFTGSLAIRTAIAYNNIYHIFL